jgi:hypothetical protein
MRKLSDVPALADLRLVKVLCDGDWSLLSLTHRAILCEGEIRTDASVPAIELTEDLERRAAQRAGLPSDGSFPGWDAVCDLLDEMLPGRAGSSDVLGEIVEAMFPGGAPDAQWSPDTLDEIAIILDRAGLSPRGSRVIGAGRSETQDRLVSLARSLGMAEDALDEAVHVLAQKLTLDQLNRSDDADEQEEIIATTERRASNLNNQGLAAQIGFLLDHCSTAEVEDLIRRCGE